MARSTRRTTTAKSNTRGFGLNTLIFLLLALVFLVIVTFPVWRNFFIAIDPVNVTFPSLTEAQRETLRGLPADQLQVLLTIAETDNARATDMAFAIQQIVTANDTSLNNLRPQRQGQFVTLDALHRAEGSAVLYDVGNNNRILRLDNFTMLAAPLHRDPAATTAGGALELRLVFSTEAVQTIEGGIAGETVDIGALRANVGSQNYTLSINPSRFKSLVIYSAKYDVVLSYAVLN